MNRLRGVRATLAVIALAGAMFFALATSSFAAEVNSECLACHSSMQTWSVGDVDRNTACQKCHLDSLVGTHPFHYAGANCGAVCHDGFDRGYGNSLYSAVPNWRGPQGSFATAASAEATPGVLHVIHTTPRWAGTAGECSSCHAAASCEACHETPPSADDHATHASNGMSSTGADYSEFAQTPWVGNVAHGDGTGIATPNTSLCGASGCHSFQGLQDVDEYYKEDFTVAADPSLDYDFDTIITKTGSWIVKRATMYSAGKASITNGTGATLSTTFTGQRIDLIADLDPYRGRAEVRIDGVLAGTIDLYAPITMYQQTVFTSDTLTPGSHTIQVRVLNSKQAAARATYVLVDQFRVYPEMTGTVSPKCDSCHADKTAAHGTTFSHEASNTAGLYSGFGCTSCHKTLMIDEHRRTGASTNDGGSVCEECHTTYAPYAIDTYDGTCGWSSYGPGCHVAASPREPHTAKDASHTVTPVPATQDCVDCHGADLGVIHDDTNASRPQHASLVGAGSNGLAYATNCLTCHTATSFPATKDCTNAACHAASGVVSMATHPAPLHPANPGSGEALRTGGYACVTCHDIELTDEHFKTASKTSGAASITCGSCHGAPYFPAGWLTPPNNTCVACHPSDASKGGAPHEAADYATKHDFSVDGANNATCGAGAGLFCHTSMSTADTLHSGAAGNCTSCHTSNASVPAIRTCTTTCHSATPHNMNLHLAPASAECVDCHETNDVRTLHPTCETCHANGSWPGITTGKTTECVGCHNPTGVGAKDYTPNSSHYSGTEAGHTATGNAASTYGGFACTQCHSLEMEQAHIGPTAIAFNTTGYDDRCETCHEVRVDSLGGWDTTCADCHAVTHGDTATKHNATTTQLSALLETQTVLSEDLESNSYATNSWTRSNTTRVRIVTTTPHAGTYTAEFYNTNTTRQTDYFEKTLDLSTYTDPRIEFWYSAVAVETGDIARVSYSTDGGGAWTDILPATATPVGWTQISGALPAQANVLVRFWGSVNTNNTEWIRFDDILLTGKAPGASPGTADANCGGGSCHNVADVAFIHNDSVPANSMNPDCATCHTNASVNPTKDCFAAGCHAGGHGLGSHTANSSQLCVDCHETGNVQTIHPTCDTCHANPSYPGITAANTAECTDCHNGLEVGGHNYAPTNPQHYAGSETTHTASAQAGTEAGFACSSCHSLEMKPEHITKTTTAFSTVPGTHTDKCVACHEIEVDNLAGAWNDTCDACHATKHTAMPTAHNGSVVGAACGTGGCHDVTDVRALHSNSVTSNATVTTCVNTCHTSATAVPTTIDCDSAGCHDGTVHPSEAEAHTTLASTGCSVCHESGDLKAVHANNCATCHGNATYPTLPAGKLECVSCHNGTDVGSHVYTPYDPNHYTALPHTGDGVEAGISNTGGKTCATCHSLEMKPEHDKTSTSFALGIYADKCAACHELNVDTLGGAWSKDCQACHTTVSVHSAYATKHDYSLTAANVTACGGANCHNVAMADVIHSSALPGAGDCTSCHMSPNSVPTQTLCTSCHSAHPNQTTVHTSTETECLNCHTGYSNVTTHVGGCAGCHSNATLVDYLKNNYTPTCTGCHNGTVLGSIYTPSDPNHYSLALHTPADFTTAVQGAGGDGTIETEGEECATCHTSTLKIAHATTTTSGGSVTCVECHTNTTLGSATVVAGSWSGDKCKDCHDTGAATTHDTYVTAHTVSTARGCAGSGASCHGTTTNIATLHGVSQVGGAPKYSSCSNSDTGESCHVTLDDRPAKVWTGTDSCGEGSTGCHTEKNTTNHGGGHVLDAAGSTYNNTTVTGCTAAGTGCHGASTGTNYQGYHPASGCTAGPCHTATNHNDAQFNDPNNCQNCHGGGATQYDNAPDVVGLTDASPAGHYNETTHTASALTTTVNGGAGGTVTATCTSCHASVGAGIDGLYNQHQALPSPYGNTTCADCHNYSAGVTAEIKTNNWTSNLCADCHNGTDMPGLAQHGTTAPAVAATPSGCSAGSAGCHSDLNLHEIHKGKSGGLVSTCAISGCHNYSAQGLKPTAKTCGTTGACHTGAVHAGEAAAHTTLASSVCVQCHESGDLSTVHADACATCHGNATYPTLPTGKLECTSCHNGTDVGTHVYTPHDPNHYTGNELVHTADGVEAGIANTGGKACNTCHLLETKLEHFKSTTSFNLGGHADRCVACHELKVDTLGGAWSKDCQACHTTVSVHNNYSAAHDFAAYNASNTTSCGGANCHNVALADVVHSSTLPGGGDCGSCHSSSESVTERLCVDCHPASPHATATAHNSVSYGATAECRSCHTAYSDITVHAGGCASCHSNATLTDYLKNNYTGNCMDCHSSGVLGGTYTPADPNHYVAATHTADIAADTVNTGGSVVTTKACTACHSTPLAAEHNVTVGVGNVSCVECHTDTTLGSATVVSNNWPTNKCADCHTATHNTMGADHDMTATSASCAGAGCHTVANISAIHADTVLTGQPTITSCSVCHISADEGRVNGATAALSTATACSSCHPGLPLHESLHLAPSSTACTSCHETNNVQTLHGALGDGCNVCHGGGGFTDVTPPGTTTACINCHASDSPADPNHYTGTEAMHTASAQTGLESGYACTQCHSTQMKPEHITKTTSAFSTVPGTYADKCIACHEVEVDTLGVWNDTCDACHAVKHTEKTAKHDATVAGAGCAGVGGEATIVSLHSENFDAVTAPAWPATWTKGGTDSALLVTSSSTASSTPNAASFASDASAAKSAFFQRTIDTSGRTNPTLSFAYNTSLPSATGTERIVPNSTVSNATYSIVGGSGSIQASIDDPDPHDTTTYASAASAGQIFVVGLGNPVAASGTINSVTLYARVATGERFRWVYNNGDGQVTDATNRTSAAYTTLSQFTVPAPTGGWTPTALQNLNVGISSVANGGWTGTCDVTQMYVEVNYTAPASAATNYLKAEYSTTGVGGPWTQVFTTSTTSGWATSTSAVPQSATLLVRFTAASDAATRILRVDDIAVTYEQAGGPSCHAVNDVSAIHNNSIPTNSLNPSCVTCHASAAAVPSTLSCTTAGCHQGWTHSTLHETTLSQDCTSCHVETNVQPPHSALGDGCNVCHGGGGYTDVAEGKSSECVSCHASESPSNATHYVGTETSHTAGALQANATLSYAGNPTCAACHSMEMKPDHERTTSAKTTYPGDICTNCHLSTALPSAQTVATSGGWTDRNTASACAACHPAAGITTQHSQAAVTGNHGVTNDTQSCASSGPGCHPVSNVSQVGARTTTANIHLACASCHGTGARANLTTPGALAQGCTGNTNCHAIYSSASHNGMNGNEVIHQATNMEADLGVASYQDQCNDCHDDGDGNVTTAGLRNVHVTRAGWTGSYCTDCHNATTPINSGAVIKGTWNQSCDACHATKHTAFTAATHDSTAGSGCTIGTCHGASGGVADIRAIHDTAAQGCTATGTDSEGWAGACHDLNKQMSSTAMSCGSGATGQACHTNHTHLNHGPAHNYSTASNYTDGSGQGLESGCSNSGAGCHGTDATYADAIATYHPQGSIDCMTSACHTSPSMTAGWKSANDDSDCANCHNGSFVNAVDAINLYDLNPAGHYGETTHTVTSGLAVPVTAGGTATASCGTCHDIGLATAHSGAGFNSNRGTSLGTKITCAECHNNYSAVVTSGWATPACTSCHVVGTYAHIDGGADAPVVNATSTAACGASGTGCHTTYNVHELHKSASGGCTLAGCHDAKNKDMTGLAGTCGQATGCHLSTIYTATLHNGVPAGRADGVDADHHTAGATLAAQTYTYNSKSAACSACHSMVLGTEHGRTTSTLSAAGANNCLKCHNDSATVSNIVKTNWPSKNTATGCSVCHANTDVTSAATAHANSANHAVGTSVTGCTGLGAGCHGVAATPDLTTVHATGCALTRACHSPTVFNPTAKTCNNAACHSTTYNTTTDYTHRVGTQNINGTETTHTVAAGNLTTTVNTGGTASAACSVCHSAALKTSHNYAVGFSTASLGWTNECTGCHNATTPINVATLVAANGTWTDSCTGNGCHTIAQKAHVDGGADALAATGSSTASCGASGNGCHSTYDLHVLHRNAAGGCALTGCHDVANKDKTPTTVTCGQATGCHLSTTYNGTSHNALTGDDVTKHRASGNAAASIGGYTQSTACTNCHSLTLKTAHGTRAGWTTPYCADCHNATSPNNSVNIIKNTAWNNGTCEACHVTKHNTYANHNSTGSSGCAISTCHGASGGTVDVRTLHDKAASGCTATGADGRGWSGACHALNTGMATTAMSCGQGATGLACHTSTTPGNHGGSAGGMNCLTAACHGSASVERLDKMVSDTTSYHHVLDAADAGVAPNTGNYPTDPAALACVSCHVDHNDFNANKGANLRPDISTLNPATGSNTDFSSTAPYGICVSCHSTARAKNTTGQKTTGASTNTPIVSGADYDVSKHDYVVGSTFGSSTFNANCSKCHDDELDLTKTYQGSTYKFGTHYSADKRIAKALAVTLVGAGTASEENLCYKCHTGAAVGNDAYGATAMTARSRGIQAEFANTSRHDVANATWTGRHKSDEYNAAPTSIIGETVATAGWWGTTNASLHVECEDCHNPHESTASSYTFPNDNASMRGTTAVPISGANKGVWGVNITGPTNTAASGSWAGSGTQGTGAPKYPTYSKVTYAAYEWQMCLKCHSRYAWGNGTPPNSITGGTDGTAAQLTDVGRDFDPANYAFHPLFATGLNQPSPAVAGNVWNTSAVRRLISGSSSGNGLSNTFVDGWLSTSRVTCSDCHNNDTWGTTQGPHGSANKWLLRGVNTGIKVTLQGASNIIYPNTGYSANSYCQNCHRGDVYGPGSGGGGDSTAGDLGRVNHGGDFNSCMDAIKVPNQVNGCNNCHGGRPNAAGTGTVKNGFMHGTNSAAGPEGGDPLGRRFCNGASWDAHTLGTGGTVGCSTINAVDNYSQCTQHTSFNKKTFTSQYNY